MNKIVYVVTAPADYIQHPFNVFGVFETREMAENFIKNGHQGYKYFIEEITYHMKKEYDED